MGAEVLRVTASPYPGNPYRWHTVAETPAFYQVAAVDTLRDRIVTDPGRDLFYKPQGTPVIRAALGSYLGRVYLDWSSWPLVADMGPVVPPDAAPGAPDWTAVSFRDLRFMYDTSLIQGRDHPPISAVVYLDAEGRVAGMELSGHAQR